MSDSTFFPPTAAQGSEDGAIGALLLPPAAGWLAAILLYGLYLGQFHRYVSLSGYVKAVWPVRAVIWAVAVLVTIYVAVVVTELMIWMTTVDRSIARIVIGTPLDSFPPLFAGLTNAPAQALLTARTLSLIRYRKLRYLFIAWMAVMILFSLTGLTLVCAVNLLSFYGNVESVAPFNFNNSLLTALWLEAVIHITISISLGLTLRQRISSRSTDGLPARVVLVVLRTASYTAVFSLAAAVTASFYGALDGRYFTLSYAFWVPLPVLSALSLFTTRSPPRNIDDYLDPSSSLPLPGASEHGLGDASYSVRKGSEFVSARWKVEDEAEVW